jgi:hypothetical protein
MTPSRLRTLATAFGGLITIACLVALVTVLAQQDTWSALVGVIHNHWGVLVGVVGVYVVLVGLQALAWWRLMQATTGTARCAASVGIFALTQVAKYLPGNVGHFVFRYALTRATGAGRAATLTATALEPWLLLLAALVGLVHQRIVFGVKQSKRKHHAPLSSRPRHSGSRFQRCICVLFTVEGFCLEKLLVFIISSRLI